MCTLSLEELHCVHSSVLVPFLSVLVPFLSVLVPFLSSLQSGDLHGVEMFERLETKGLYTLQTVVVDYRGYRVVCQSIVPGIFAPQGIQVTRRSLKAVIFKEMRCLGGI